MGTTGGDFWTDRLSAYLDGDLANGERRAFEAHLATCSECARSLEELRAVVARARTLETRGPERDLWPAIASRLEPRAAGIEPVAEAPRALRLRPAFPWWRGRLALSVPQLAAAALALVLVSSGTVVLLLSRRPTPALVSRMPAATARPGGASIPASLASFQNDQYDATVIQLRQVLDQHRGQLDPRTVKVIEDNLRIIDRATEEARRALAADPANPYLNDHLVEQMQRKVDVLRQVALLVSARG